MSLFTVRDTIYYDQLSPTILNTTETKSLYFQKAPDRSRIIQSRITFLQRRCDTCLCPIQASVFLGSSSTSISTLASIDSPGMIFSLACPSACANRFNRSDTCDESSLGQSPIDCLGFVAPGLLNVAEYLDAWCNEAPAGLPNDFEYGDGRLGG